MNNFLCKGVRIASDFLMSLQLGGAFKKSSIFNLQLRMPIIVIGGGLTAVDTATEALAYYPLQVKKFLIRYQELVAKYGSAQVEQGWNDEEREIAQEFISHAKILNTLCKDKTTEFLHSLGGAKILYRKSIFSSPAYRLNHEELQSALDEGIGFVENAVVTSVIQDQYGAIKQVMTICNGKSCSFNVRSLLVAIGTKHNDNFSAEVNDKVSILVILILNTQEVSSKQWRVLKTIIKIYQQKLHG